jgi:CARDB
VPQALGSAECARIAFNRNSGPWGMFSSSMLLRLLVPLLPTAALLAAAPAAAPAELPAVLPATVRLVDCSPDESSAAFYGRMRPVDDSVRMWMRFTLLEKRLDRYEGVKAPGLSRWHKSKPGVGAFGYRQAVRGLQPGGVYKVRVSFRWYSEDGELIERTRRTSGACRQFEEVPNLTSTVAGAEGTKVAGVLRYVLLVSNTGEADAAAVDVRLSVDGSVVNTVTLASLAAGESREVAVRGPQCGSSVASLADPEGVIVESSEDDNGESVACADLDEP